MGKGLQEATKEWVDTIIELFEGYPSDALNQVYMKGYFAGWSTRDVLNMAKRMKEANDKFPVPKL